MVKEREKMNEILCFVHRYQNMTVQSSIISSKAYAFKYGGGVLLTTWSGVKVKYSLRSWRGKSVKEREREVGRTMETSCHSSHKLDACGCLLPCPFLNSCISSVLPSLSSLVNRDVLMYHHPTRVRTADHMQV